MKKSNIKRLILVLAVTAITVVAFAATAHAATPVPMDISGLSDGIGEVQAQAQTGISSNLKPGMLIGGLILVIGIVWGIFKKMSKGK